MEDTNSIENRKKRREMAIDNAIRCWTDSKNGIFRWYNDSDKDCTPEYCQEQIEYFKNLKNKK